MVTAVVSSEMALAEMAFWKPASDYCVDTEE